MAAVPLTRLTTDSVSKVFAPGVAAGAQEDAYTFTDNQFIGTAMMEFTCTVAWNFRTASAGSNYPVAANTAFRVMMTSGQTVYGGISAAGTMSIVMVG